MMASTSNTVLEDSAFEPLPYSLDLDCPVPWPSSQEAVMCQDYPFPLIDNESLQEFVIRRYLETLWLPESIMPLHHFVQSLSRAVSSPSRAHTLRGALNPLLLSVRATEDKYHHELPQILHDGGGAGELEETMMWYAWSKEKFEAGGNGDGVGECGNHAEETCKKSWMERLERREVQIQVILYFQLLSLPPAPPTTPVASKPETRKRKQPRGPPSHIKSNFPLVSSVEAATTPSTPSKSTISTTIDEGLSLEERLEYFMDRLSLWQLIASLNLPSSSQPTLSQMKGKDERDWMQVFCEDIVESLFKDRLPNMCALLRSKVFPHSPFSDDDSDGSPPPLPDLRSVTRGKTKRKRPPSPLRLAELEKPRAGSAAQCRAGSSQPSSKPADSQHESGAPDRHRSRSRSVSISVDEVRARGASRGGVATSKNLFKGEVEMKRTASKGSKLFKPPRGGQTANSREVTRQNSRSDAMPSIAQSRPSLSCSPSQSRGPKTLAADTPVKKLVKVEEDTDVVMDSPDVLSLTRTIDWDQGEDPDEQSTVFATDTPVKKPPRR